MQIRPTLGPEVLNWTAVDAAEPGSGQVRLRQAAKFAPQSVSIPKAYHANMER
jgi:hypothetical protein